MRPGLIARCAVPTSAGFSRLSQSPLQLDLMLDDLVEGLVDLPDLLFGERYYSNNEVPAKEKFFRERGSRQPQSAPVSRSDSREQALPTCSMQPMSR